MKGVKWWDGRLTGEDSIISFASDSVVSTVSSKTTIAEHMEQRLAGQTSHCVRCHAMYNPGINYWGACRLAHVFDGGILGLGGDLNEVRSSEESVRREMLLARKALDAGPAVPRAERFWKRAVCCLDVFLQETAPGSDSWGKVQGPDLCYVGYHSTTPSKIDYNRTSVRHCSQDSNCTLIAA
ncbi:hypothetical protein BDV93DRAFT_603658 [Ceratobasidium sp. AG-I]|nr:hypothetical protein BDV93DRAFT_603658 [Ceratobasidium sp. AG-I]